MLVFGPVRREFKFNCMICLILHKGFNKMLLSTMFATNSLEMSAVKIFSLTFFILRFDLAHLVPKLISYEKSVNTVLVHCKDCCLVCFAVCIFMFVLKYQFLPHNAMLAWYMLSSYVCLSICLYIANMINCSQRNVFRVTWSFYVLGSNW